MQETEDRLLLIRYLLGDLNDGEQEGIEERYFVDDNFHIKLLATEDELIDSYVLGELSPADHTRFEQVYLTNPHKLNKVEANRQVLDLIAKRLAPSVPYHRRALNLLPALRPGRHLSLNYALAGLLLLGILCGWLGWLLFERGRMRGELEQARKQWQQTEIEYQRQLAALKQPQPSPEPSQVPPDSLTVSKRSDRSPSRSGAQEQASAPRARSTPAVVAFTLLSGGLRAPTADRYSLGPLVIPRGAVLVRLKIALEPNEYAAYRVSLRKVGGREDWTQTVVKQRPDSVTQQLEIALPAGLFQSRDYILKVTGTDSTGEEEILAFHQITAINQNLGRKQTDDMQQ